jgi:hypothetical protein
MKGILELSPKEARIFPDANSTLRVTYGKVKGYAPSDAVYYSPVTYLEGVMEKYIPGDYEFDVSPKLIELYNKKILVLMLKTEKCRLILLVPITLREEIQEVRQLMPMEI